MNDGKIHIQHELNKIQLKHGYLPANELEAFSALAKALHQPIPLHRIHEVASFFPHYRLAKPASIEVKVCRDMSCHLRDSEDCRKRLERVAEGFGDVSVTLGGVSCLGRCDHAPAIVIEDRVFDGMSIDDYEALLKRRVETGSLPPAAHAEVEEPPWKINEPYRGLGQSHHYQAVRDLLAPDTEVAEALQNPDGSGILEALKKAGLRGMGGPGEPTAAKWGEVKRALAQDRDQVGYVVCNADESEPGTFKDRELMLRTPHLVVEGVILAGLTVGARWGYIYVRHEYHEQIEELEREIERARKLGVCGENILGTGRSMSVEVYVSPGGYVCGEQSALIEAMEDKRSEPRNKPPELKTNGLWDRPTLVNNVETLSWVPAIALRGGAWYAGLGVRGSTGMRFFSISGDLERPGVFEVPIGTTFGELIDLAGGIRDGKELRAVATSGPSGGFQPRIIPITEKMLQRLPKTFPPDRIAAGAKVRDMRDMELDSNVLGTFGIRALGAGIVVYAEGRDMAEQALVSTQFYRNESCGKCVPCRQGSQRLSELGAEILEGTADRGRIDEIRGRVAVLHTSLIETSICGLGMVAAEPLATAFQNFPDDIDRHVYVRSPAPTSEPTR